MSSELRTLRGRGRTPRTVRSGRRTRYRAANSVLRRVGPEPASSGVSQASSSTPCVSRTDRAQTSWVQLVAGPNPARALRHPPHRPSSAGTCRAMTVAAWSITAARATTASALGSLHDPDADQAIRNLRAARRCPLLHQSAPTKRQESYTDVRVALTGPASDAGRVDHGAAGISPVERSGQPVQGPVADLGVARAHLRGRIGGADHVTGSGGPGGRSAPPASTQAAWRAAPSATYSRAGGTTTGSRRRPARSGGRPRDGPRRRPG